MNWKEFTTDYLSFTKKERLGIIVITLLILAVFFLPTLIVSRNYAKKTTTDTTWIAAVKEIEQKKVANNSSGYKEFSDENSTTYQYDRSANNYYNKPKGELFYFDPNTLSPEGWQKLGLREKTIHTIQNYLSKGGHFKKAEDLQKVYGLFPDEYERIAPYIKIEADNDPVASNDLTNKPVEQNQSAKSYPSRYTAVDINTADTTTLIALPGIGSKLATRIINFRDKLGGFYSINQVSETFGLPDSAFQKIKPYLQLKNAMVRKININTATLDELKEHPYIRYNLANPIIAYRNQHGPFEKVEDLKKVMALTEDNYNKIVPYVITR